jgi:hypothetical protein
MQRQQTTKLQLHGYKHARFFEKTKGTNGINRKFEPEKVEANRPERPLSCSQGSFGFGKKDRCTSNLGMFSLSLFRGVFFDSSAKVR